MSPPRPTLATTLATTLIATLAGVLALGAPAAAEPTTAHRKASPNKFVKAASQTFGEALTADEAGKLPEALGLYQKAFAISPHPSTVYNIADVQRRLGQLAEAIKSYETYLALAPTAADRKEVEGVLDRLARTPGTLAITTTPASDPKAIDLTSAYILVNGAIRKKPGVAPAIDARSSMPVIELAVPAGKLIVDIVTPLTHGQRRCEVKPGARMQCLVTAPPRIDGNVVLSVQDTQLRVHTEPKARSVSNQRLAVPPGRTKLMLRDRSYECRALVFDASSAGDVAYAFVSSTDHDGLERCRRLNVQQHTLRFEP